MANPRLNWDPLRDIDEVTDRINRLFNRNLAGETDTSRWGIPATDVYEENNHLVIEVFLPNFQENEVDVRINQNRLEIRAEQRAENERRDRNYLRRETQAASFYREFVLPDDINIDSGAAEFRDGVLRITFNRRQGGTEPRHLALRGARAGAPQNGQSGSQQGSNRPGQQPGQPGRAEDLRQTDRHGGGISDDRR